ncbi:methylthioribose kinase [Cytobacillus sp. NJ13]|nr:methylthioribose kinase [Cytobacillus sp. NJ13]
MIQRFIEIGEGYSDIYELIEIARANKHRLSHMAAFHTSIDKKEVASLAVILKPTDPGGFQPLYICREGIPNPKAAPNKRYELFADAAEDLNKEIIQLTVKPSVIFNEKELYFQYLIGILRLNHYIAPLQ